MNASNQTLIANNKSKVIFSILRYFKSSLSLHKIAYMSIFTTTSIALVLIVNTFVPIIIIQSFRVAFAGIFVKLSGYLLGPILGVISGFLTDMFLLMLRPSDYNPGYTLVLMLFGLLAGLTYFLREREKKWKGHNSIFIATVIVIFAIGGIETSIIVTTPSVESIALFNISFLQITSLQSVALLVGGLIICLTTAIFFRVAYQKKVEVMNDLLLILLMNTIVDFAISQPLISYFDQFSSIGGVPYTTLFISRLGTTSITILWNTMLIYLIWKIINPLLQRKLYN